MHLALVALVALVTLVALVALHPPSARTPVPLIGRDTHLELHPHPRCCRAAAAALTPMPLRLLAGEIGSCGGAFAARGQQTERPRRAGVTSCDQSSCVRRATEDGFSTKRRGGIRRFVRE